MRSRKAELSINQLHSPDGLYSLILALMIALAMPQVLFFCHETKLTAYVTLALCEVFALQLVQIIVIPLIGHPSET